MPFFDKLRRACRDGVDAGTTPGLAVAVGISGQTIFLEAFGRRQIEPAPEPATPDTVYDLASLTKALVTSVLAMRAVGSGQLRLGDPLVTPSAPREPSAPCPSLGQALAHSGGFVAHRPFYERLTPDERSDAARSRQRIVELAAAEPAAYAPGTRSIYSDLGFILLGDRLERTLGARLDVLAARDLFVPLGVPGLCFADVHAPSPFVGRPVAATQKNSSGESIVGEVDDRNAHAMSGIAGHAGLFGTAADVATFVHALCAAWRDSGPAGGRPIVPAEVLRTFWSPAQIPGSNWRLGWDGPAAHGSLAGDRISRRAVGHLAFTGCSVWIDPERETFVILLSNRVHPVAREDARFRDLRRAVNDAALEGARYPATVA